MDESTVDRRFLLGALGGAAGVAALAKMAQAGPLSPPAGPIAPTGKTVQEIYDKIARTDVGLAEPRIPVQSLPGSATALHVISQPGSYYLTGNILGVAGKNGIEIAADGVTLDLKGFALIGVPGSLSAIYATGTHRLLRVMDGAIAIWGDRGIALQDSNEVLVEAIRVGQCAFDGITVGGNCIVRNCVARQNGFAGVSVFEAGVIQQCAATGNGFAGVTAGFHTVIDGCTSLNNRWGINLYGSNNIVMANSCSVNTEVGINVVGLVGCRIEANNVNENPVGIRVQGSNNLVIKNSARLNTTNFDVAATNSIGPIVNVAGVGAITAVPNANHPWANFIY